MRKFFLYTTLFIGAALTITSCNGNTDDSSTDQPEDSVSVSKRKVGDDTTGVAIAYYVQDSIASNFNFYRSY